MFPTEIEATVPPPYASGSSDPFRWKRILIAILAVTAFLLMIVYFIRPLLFKPNTQREQLDALLSASPTPMPATGTFVDSLYGTILFKSEGEIKEMELPSRLVNLVVASVDPQIPRESKLPDGKPTWSSDGELLFVSTQSRSISAVTFETGEYVATYTLRNDQSTSASVVVSSSPGNEVLAVGSPVEAHGSEYLEFFDILSGNQMGFYDNCSPKGIWMEEIGFVAKCKLGSNYSIVLIQFYENSSQMIPVAKETDRLSYQLLDAYDQSRLFVNRVEQGKPTLGTLTLEGKFTVLPAAEARMIPSIEAASDPMRFLASRLEKDTKLPNISQVQVSSDNLWVIFRSNATIYVALMDLREAPYAIGDWEWVSLRPR
ncbi:hypothetical protein KBD71_00875 [Candidatus Woesebacteria bacterium]|nr:hypothetical protein [Candidatus Woesebacteria bacterium]